MSRRVRPEITAEVERLFLATAPALFSYACALPLMDRYGAEDLVQEAFHDAVLSWDKLAGRDTEGRRQWLFTVVRHKAIDQWRANRRCETRPDLAGLPSTEKEITDRALCSAALERCWSVIQKMPPVRQKVVFLKWNEGWSTAEIAEWLDIAQATVRGHIKKARDELVIQVRAELPFIGDHETDEGG